MARKKSVLSKDSIESINEQMALLEIKKMQALEKGLRSASPLDVLRANDELAKFNSPSSPENQKSYTFDPFQLQNNLGFKDTFSAVSFNHLRAMGRTPLVRGIIDTRQDQVASFSKANADDGSVGWTIRKKMGIFADDAGEELTKTEKLEIESIIDFLESGGREGNVKGGGKGRRGSLNLDHQYDRFNRTSFEQFLRLSVRDTLTIDQLCWEMISDRGGNLVQQVNTDSATFRFADERSYYDKDGNPMPDKLIFGQVPKYVQIYDGRPVADFYSWELSFGIRNKVTDIRNNGYGISELEDLVKVVTWMLFGDQYNGKFFTQGAAPKGILKVMGNVNQDRLAEFRLYWRQMVTGVENAWRTPVLEADKVEWIDLQKSNQDMQFSAWQEYLIRILCALYKIDPTEMGFMMRGGGGDNYASHKQRTDYSKDKGLVPVLRFLQSEINRYIISRLTDKYEFAWTGIDVENEVEAADLDEKRVRTWETVNQVRERKGQKPLPDGDIILNSVYIQAKQMKMMGGEESNDYVDEETGEDDGNYYKENPFDMEDEVQKSSYDELNRWIADGMPSTIKPTQDVQI